jgi:hypothetical protein
LAKPTGPSPVIGNLINFDNLTPFSTFDPDTYSYLPISQTDVFAQRAACSAVIALRIGFGFSSAGCRAARMAWP